MLKDNIIIEFSLDLCECKRFWTYENILKKCFDEQTGQTF